MMLGNFRLSSLKVIMQSRWAINMVIWSRGLSKRVGGSLKCTRALWVKSTGLRRDMEQMMLVFLSSCNNHWCLQHSGRQTDAKHPQADLLKNYRCRTTRRIVWLMCGARSNHHSNITLNLSQFCVFEKFKYFSEVIYLMMLNY